MTGNQGLPVVRAHRETPDVVAGVCRMVRAVGKRIAQEDTDGLDHLKALQAAVDEAWGIAIPGLRLTYSDSQIGRELGITRQAVQKRWPRRDGVAA